MQLLKVTSNNLILSLVDDGDIALAGKTVRAVTDTEETTINTLWKTNRFLIDDPAGIRAETSSEFNARQPIDVQIKAAFAALPAAARGAFLTIATPVLDAVKNKDYAAAREVVGAATNVTASTLTSDQFTALQSGLLAIIPAA